MHLSLSKAGLRNYTSRQLNNFFPDQYSVNLDSYTQQFDIALDRLDNCFQKVSYTRYNKDGHSILDHLYADQYLVFIWFLANTIWKESEDINLASKLYYLNKSLHGFDCMYDTALPDIFLIFHGVGTMLGKAFYSDYLVVLQGATIGSHKGKYPRLGKGIAITAHGAIIGDCQIGDRVSISASTSVFQRDISSDSVVYNDLLTGTIQSKPSKIPYAQQFYNVDLNEL
jgi:serine O-acetyltransferase